MGELTVDTRNTRQHGTIATLAVLVPMLVLSACALRSDAESRTTEELIAILENASAGNPTDDYPNKGKFVTDSTSGVPFVTSGPRCDAARELAKRKPAGVLDMLVAALRDGRVDGCIVEPLGALGDPQAILPLLDAFGQGAEYADRPDEGLGLVECTWDDPKLCLPWADVHAALRTLVAGGRVSPLDPSSPAKAGLDQLIPLGDAAGYLASEERCSREPGDAAACREMAKRDVVTSVLSDFKGTSLEPIFVEWLKFPKFSDRAGEQLAVTYRDDVDHLLPLLQSADTVAISKGIIRLGKAGTEQALIDALMKFGEEELATYYLNCGNSELEAAAESWATANGYTITRTYTYGGSDKPVWGSTGS